MWFVRRTGGIDAMPPSLTLTTINIGAPDAAELARFYSRLLGWDIAVEEPDWAVMRDPEGGVGLAFQTEAHYTAPVWPAGVGEQQMMLHLEIRVDDLAAATSHALACGASLADL